MHVHMVQYMSVGAGGRAERACVSLCRDVVERCAFLRVCASASCTCIVHAWLASAPEVQGPGKQAGVALWRRGSHPLVCAVTSVEGFPPTRCKRGRQQRRTGAVSTAWVGDGLLCAPTMSSSSRFSLLSHVCFSIQHSTLTAL